MRRERVANGILRTAMDFNPEFGETPRGKKPLWQTLVYDRGLRDENDLAKIMKPFQPLPSLEEAKDDIERAKDMGDYIDWMYSVYIGNLPDRAQDLWSDSPHKEQNTAIFERFFTNLFKTVKETPMVS